MAAYRRLLVVGRFQPPHYGHIHTVGYALRQADDVLIIIGSAQESYTLRNPLTAGERFYLLEKTLKARFPQDYCWRIRVVPVMDVHMNKVWVRYLEMLLPRFDGVVTRNPLVAELFRDAGYPVVEQPLYNREECEGTLIREKALRGGDWLACIPEEIRGDLERLDFEGRLRRLARKD